MGVEFTTGNPPWNLPTEEQPSSERIRQLKSALSANSAISNRKILINQFGEWTPYTPEELAGIINDGTVYVEYCGIPMLYTGSVYVLPKLRGVAERFSDFLRVIGRPLPGFPFNKAGDVLFMPKLYSCPFPGIPRYRLLDPFRCYSGYIKNYPYEFGLVNYINLTKKSGFYVPSGSAIGKQELGPFPDYKDTLVMYVYSAFGVCYGKGWYFYAAGYYRDRGVAPDTYAKYISAALTGVTPPGNGGEPPPTEPGPSPGCDPGKCPTPRPTILQGSSSPCVGLAQQFLAQAGYSPGPVDCVFGPQTDSAVRAFQRARGLAVDGIVGPQTWAALESAAGDGGQQPQPVPPPPPPPPVPWLLYAGIGVTALLAMLAGYHLVRGPRPPEE